LSHDASIEMVDLVLSEIFKNRIIAVSKIILKYDYESLPEKLLSVTTAQTKLHRDTTRYM